MAAAIMQIAVGWRLCRKMLLLSSMPRRSLSGVGSVFGHGIDWCRRQPARRVEKGRTSGGPLQCGPVVRRASRSGPRQHPTVEARRAGDFAVRPRGVCLSENCLPQARLRPLSGPCPTHHNEVSRRAQGDPPSRVAGSGWTHTGRLTGSVTCFRISAAGGQRGSWPHGPVRVTHMPLAAALRGAEGPAGWCSRPIDLHPALTRHHASEPPRSAGGGLPGAVQTAGNASARVSWTKPANAARRSPATRSPAARAGAPGPSPAPTPPLPPSRG